jgi:exodeoxyribonuclease V alpha subunit
METIKATVSRIVYSNEENGFKVLNTRTPGGSNLIITGEFGPEIIPESVASFHGDYKTHSKYGHQFKARSYTIVHNAQELASIKIFLDSIAYNIGPERSEAIISCFGLDTIKIIENEPDKLMDVPGIGKVCADAIKTAWQANRQKWAEERVIYSLRAFLCSLGIREKRIKKILVHFGGHEYDAEQVIRQNPYCLIDVEDFGFTTVDFIARQLGVPEESQERLKAFIFYLLDVQSPSDGHLFLSVKEILEYVTKHCEETNTKFLGTDINDWDIYTLARELAKDKKIVFEDSNLVYSNRQYKFETESASQLVKIMEEKSNFILLDKKAVEDFIKNFEAENRIKLSAEQEQALYYFAEKKVFIITGSPGTGKTLILKAISQLAKKMGLTFTCLTPTGISAKKLASVIGHDAYTVHRRLGYRGNEWEYGEKKKFQTDVIFFDESSMLDQEVFYHLITALNKSTHIVFVGDHNQLPAVGPGNVLRELINSDVIPVVRLDKIFRQDAGSDIIEAAHRIIQGDTKLELFKNDPTADVYFMRVKDITEIEKIVVALADKFKTEKRQFQVLSPRNQGPLGIETLNKLLQEALNPESPELNELKLRDFTLRRGDRVIIKKNDYSNDIYNGDIGKIIEIGAGRISIKIDERVIDLSIEDVNDKIKLAYTVTVHNSQGQEYKCVILLFINQFGKNMLQRNLLYTALTRAKEKVIVIGHGSAIERAIENTSVTKRNTILGERIRRCFDPSKVAISQESLSEPETSQSAPQNTEQRSYDLNQVFQESASRFFLSDTTNE